MARCAEKLDRSRRRAHHPLPSVFLYSWLSKEVMLGSSVGGGNVLLLENYQA